MGGMHDAVANGIGKGGVSDSLVPLGNRKLGAEQRGGAAVAILQDLKQDQSAGCIEDLQPEIVQLCGAPHNWTNGETAVMWSRSRNCL